MEIEVRDLVRRFYGLRNMAQIRSETSQRIIFVAQHTLAMSRFPRLIQSIKEYLPETAYRVNPANNNECEALFLNDADFLLCYETENRRFDFSHRSIRRVELENDRLIPVASARFIEQFDNLDVLFSGNLPLLVYQQGGFLADVLVNACLPAVLRDYRIEVICESAFSAGLREMVLADMGIAWLAHGMIENQLNDGTLVSLESRLGAAELDVVLYFREDSGSDKARAIYDLLDS